MKKRHREVEIFSLSAVDLFAAAMSAFILITIILIPYYRKEILSSLPKTSISDQKRAAEQSQVEAVVKREAVEDQRSASAKKLSDIREEVQKALAEYNAQNGALLEKMAERDRAIEANNPKPEEKKPAPDTQKALVSFRFLGMKTTKARILVLVDLNKCQRGHEGLLDSAIVRILDSLQSHHSVAVWGFQQLDSGPTIHKWPANGGLENATGRVESDTRIFINSMKGRLNGSSSMLNAVRAALASPADAIFLISDGLPNPAANDGLRPTALASRIASENGRRKEIHTVVVGPYYQYRGTVEFMEKIANENGGQFMALASNTQSSC
jgi:hypothetical protein